MTSNPTFIIWTTLGWWTFLCVRSVCFLSLSRTKRIGKIKDLKHHFSIQPHFWPSNIYQISFDWRNFFPKKFEKCVSGMSCLISFIASMDDERPYLCLWNEFNGNDLESSVFSLEKWKSNWWWWKSLDINIYFRGYHEFSSNVFIQIWDTSATYLNALDNKCII